MNKQNVHSNTKLNAIFERIELQLQLLDRFIANDMASGAYKEGLAGEWNGWKSISKFMNEVYGDTNRSSTMRGSSVLKTIKLLLMLRDHIIESDRDKGFPEIYLQGFRRAYEEIEQFLRYKFGL
jgi:hypothetical protein